jgi:sugar lactone lactonase YvrE
MSSSTYPVTDDLPATRWARKLRPGQAARLHVVDVTDGSTQVLLESDDVLLEAPPWPPGGRWIVVNADGVLFRVDVTAGRPALERIPSTGLPELNNDHLIAPDGRSHLVSANDGHLYRLPFDGGEAVRLTRDKAPQRRFRHFLHGVSPDGGTLAYVGTEDLDGDEWGNRSLWLLDLHTGHEELLGDGYSPADGPDYTPDGGAVWFNSEFRSDEDGHSQVFRHDLADGSVRQFTTDERVNWFPHPSPDGARVAYLSYPAGTLGHPADRPVRLRVVDPFSGVIVELAELFGGQGTINVTSWAPDSRRLAYVSYPLDGPSSGTGSS